MYEIIFRCDGSSITNVGTGHIYRSLAIADFLVKNYKIRREKILFVTKKYKEYLFIKKIIINKKYKVKSFLGSELNVLKKLKSKSLIIDRVKKEKQSNIDKLKQYFNKIIILDSENKTLKNCLRINSLILNKKSQYSGFKYLISPLVNNFKTQIKIKKKKVFISLGGLNNKKKIINILNKLKNLTNIQIAVPDFIKLQKNTNYIFYNNNSFYDHLLSSSIVICSGGLILFDSLFLSKKIICIPKDEYQSNNIKNIHKLTSRRILTINNVHNLEKNFINILKQKKEEKFFNVTFMKNTIRLIYKYINDK